MSDVEVFNRIDEARLQSQNDGITPLQFAKKKVEYYHVKYYHGETEPGDKHLLDVWIAVAKHFEDNA